MRQVILLLLFLGVVHLGLPVISSGNKYAAPSLPPADRWINNIPAVPELWSDVVEITGHEGEFELKEADVPNLEAIIQHGKKYILYNPDYIGWLNTVTKNKWATMTLLAHEIAHHIKGHTKKRSGSKPRLELQADEYAGYVLQQLGASLQHTQEVMNFIAKPKGSRTHPGRSARLEAIQKGWYKAANMYATAGID